MKHFLIGRSPLTTIAGYLLALLTVLCYALAGGAQQWQNYVLPAALAVLGRLASDEFRRPTPPPSHAAALAALLASAGTKPSDVLRAALSAICNLPAEESGKDQHESGAAQGASKTTAGSSLDDYLRELAELLNLCFTAECTCPRAEALADEEGHPLQNGCDSRGARPFRRRGRVYRQGRGLNGRFTAAHP